MTDDPTERKLRLAEAVRPYDQDGYPPWVEGEPRPFDWPPERPRRPFLSHLYRWGLIYLAIALIVFLAFAAGVWRGHRTADPFDQSTFPCQEDEALVYAPSFGPDKVGCVNREDLG